MKKQAKKPVKKLTVAKDKLKSVQGGSEPVPEFERAADQKQTGPR